MGEHRTMFSRGSKPVLVRERTTPVDRVAFAQEANTPTVLAMGPAETAMVDASRIPDEAIAGITVGESESLDTALKSAANRDLVQSFAATLPANEQTGSG